jgi:hypothetical protein
MIRIAPVEIAEVDRLLGRGPAKFLLVKPGDAFYGVWRDGELVSVGAVGRVGKRIKLRANYTPPIFRRRGYFSLLLGNLIARYGSTEMLADCLDPSLAIYLRHGFVVQRTRQCKDYRITYVRRPPSSPRSIDGDLTPADGQQAGPRRHQQDPPLSPQCPQE